MSWQDRHKITETNIDIFVTGTWVSKGSANHNTSSFNSTQAIDTYISMDIGGEEFLKRKFLHLFDCFDHGRKGFIERQDAELQSKKLLSTLRRQLQERGMADKDIEQRVEEFDANWMPGAMKYFAEMSQFAKEGGPEKITVNDFMSFNMSIRDHIVKNDSLPLWFEDSLRKSFQKCWASNDNAVVGEEGLGLLPGVTNETKSVCHHHLNDNNNKKIDISQFLFLIKGYYSSVDPKDISKYIHGYLNE